MKCINCGTDNNLRDRTANSGHCTRCNHQFAFEPTAMTQGIKFTDPFFAKLLNDISVNKTLYFTPKQLLYFLDKRLKYKKISVAGIGCILLLLFFNVWTTLFFGGFLYVLLGGGSIIIVPIVLNLGVLIWLFNQSRSKKLTYQDRQNTAKSLLILTGFLLVVGLSISLSLNLFPLLVASTIIGMLFIYLAIRQLRNKKSIAQEFLISLSQVQDWLRKWQTINGSFEKILSPSFAATQPVQINPEILNYSFDRVIVCQSTEIARFLIANNFHFENNCAVLSVTRYPENIFDVVLEMLRRNRDLKVYALHNANSRGVTLVNHLRTQDNWFADSSATIYDIGLSPRQVLDNPKLFVQQSDTMAREAKELPQEIRQTLLPEEINWLEAGYFVELESFSPQHLLRIVTQGIILSRQENDLIFVEDNSLYMVQSFG
ncbi:hypothetical protein [Gloeothece verrucosa]|uniref:Uncharacterized protein n=1 Tax=Gloeothece verrucosa (strain PCC 7822) TaxID=497965 RepID=E0UMT7_GLOV7|nr:hypothetical protein [Gloeothece verrucosa]ADN18267.1 conserved hypothetical protein [Gloeothece verrucosa PCC 7822]